MKRPSITILTRRPMPRTTGGTGMPPTWTRASRGGHRTRHRRPQVATWRKSCTLRPYEFIAADSECVNGRPRGEAAAVRFRVGTPRGVPTPLQHGRAPNGTTARDQAVIVIAVPAGRAAGVWET